MTADAPHFFQLARVRLADGRVLLVDRCRECGALADPPTSSIVAILD
jgi:hypothetical protein